MDRKIFLKKVGIGLVTGSAFMASCKKEETPSPSNTSSEDCKLTGKDDLGPFFVGGSANIVNLNTQNLSGISMMMTGKVYSGEDKGTPIEGAKIEIWHADDNGTYHPEGSGDVSNYSSSEITLRGFVLTDTDGAFAFQSIRPGLYGSRARHLHYKITVSGHEELVTQSYFEGDNRIPMDELSKSAGECRIVTYQDNGNAGIVGSMDFNLKKV